MATAVSHDPIPFLRSLLYFSASMVFVDLTSGYLIVYFFFASQKGIDNLWVAFAMSMVVRFKF